MILNHDAQLAQLPANMRFFIRELLCRGVEIDWPDGNGAAFVATLGGHVEFFQDVCPLKTPFSAVQIFSNKQLARHVLKTAGFAVVDGQSFRFDERSDALSYFKGLNGPAVVKPTLGIEGDGVRTGLTAIEEVDAAIYEIQRNFPQYGEYVVERHFQGHECRVFVTENGEHAAILREPASVTGDGKATIAELASRESLRRTDPRKNCLGPIPLDNVVDHFLKKSGLKTGDVPAKGEKVFLRDNSNLKTGGAAKDVTSEIHPSVIEICHEILKATRGLPFAGIDFMSHDLFKPQTPKTYAIIEVNPIPGIGMHLAPGEGISRPVDKMIADIAFPETRGA